MFPSFFDKTLAKQLDKQMDFTDCTTKDGIFSPGKIAIWKSDLQTQTLKWFHLKRSNI